MASTLDKDVILAEGAMCLLPKHDVSTDFPTGYKEYQTGRKYMARMGDWRDNKDVEIPLDGIGGVSILVKADVHRSGR